MPGELKAFLTHKRGLIAPDTVGLQGSLRRRSPGLTREDMAELVGVSFKWYQLFESGKASGVSRRLVERVAQALQLNAAERHYLLQLVGHLDSDPEPAIQAAPAPLVDLVRRSGALPMALYSPLFDVLAANNGYQGLFPPSEAEHEFAGNKLWRLFLDPVYRATWCDWDRVAARVVSDFRYTSASCVLEPRYQALLADLSRDSDFCRLWSGQAINAIGGGPTRFELQPPGRERCEVEVVVLRPMEAPQLVLAALMPL